MSDLQRRSEALLKTRGYLTASVERRKRFPDPKARRCQACGSVRMLDIASDMFGVFDLIGLRKFSALQLDFIFVQVTDRGDHSKRRNKIIASPEAKLCILSGARILIQSWKKVANRWAAYDEWVTEDMFVHGLPDTIEQFYEDEQRRKHPEATVPFKHQAITDDSLPF